MLIMLRFAKQLVLWTVICTGCAAPSYLLALTEYSQLSHHLAMWAGVGCVILLYAIISSTRWAQQFRKRPFVMTTLWWGYGTRLAISAFSLVMPFVILADVYTGISSIEIATNGLGLTAKSARMVFVTTLIQAAIWNVLLLVYMSIVYGLQRAFRNMPTPQDVCANCAYDLRASGEICPECGTPRRSAAEEFMRAETG